MCQGHVASRGGLIGLVGKLCGESNVFLIDSGASSNFMSKSLALEYGFKVHSTGNKFNVRLANGRVVTTDGYV